MRLLCRRRVVTTCLLVLAVFTSQLGSFASADWDRRRDARDADGALDIRRISYGHENGQLVHRLSTYESWKSRSLYGTRRYIAFYISVNDRPDSNEGWERILWVHYKNERLVAELYRPGEGGPGGDGEDVRMKRVPVSRPNNRSIRVTFAPGDLGDQVQRYRLDANTSWQTKRGPCSGRDTTVDNPAPFDDGSCFDGARELRHRL
jgi:hypothetical protein